VLTCIPAAVGVRRNRRESTRNGVELGSGNSLYLGIGGEKQANDEGDFCARRYGMYIQRSLRSPSVPPERP
jgi:hypothetical protein